MNFPKEPTGPTGPIGYAGDLGPRGTAAPKCYCEQETWSWRPLEEKEYPHGWENNSHAGVRGTWGTDSEEELLEHLVYWLTECLSKKPSMKDPAGNVYYGVDSNVLSQTLESLRHYQRLLTQPLGQQISRTR